MIVFRKFQSISEVNAFLQGGITVAKALQLRQGKLFGLHGLTLVFTAPAAATVTFSDPTSAGLDLKAVGAAILAQTTGAVRAQFANEGTHTRLILIEVSPTSGVALADTSTALAAFGFDGDGVAGTFYAPPDGVAPRFIATEGSHAADSFIVITEET